jgi:hypothetical protein
LPANKELSETLRSYENVLQQRGMLTREEFRLIRACLHTDRSMSDSKMAEAFHVISRVESLMVGDKGVIAKGKAWMDAAKAAGMPMTGEELMARMKKKKR